MASTTTFHPSTSTFSSPRGSRLPIPPHHHVLSFLFDLTSSSAFHHRLALVDASSASSLTFLQLRSRIHSTALALSSLGLHQHDVALILSPNTIDFPVVFFAILSLGAVATTVNPVSTPSEILKQARSSQAKLILTVPDLLPKVLNSGLPLLLIDGPDSPSPQTQIPPPTSSVVRSLSEIVRHASSTHHRLPPVHIRQTDTAALLYSSGTTGVSKGVVLSHRNFIAASMQVNSDAEDLNEKDLTFLVIIPFFHVYGLSVILFGQLQRGNTIVTMPKFDFIQMLEAIQTYQVTDLPLVPPILLALANQDVALKYDLSSVREITCGAAPIGKETLEEVYRRFKVPDIRQGYGMTETGGIISLLRLQNPTKNYASVGQLVMGVEAVIVDPSSGERLPPNKLGELWVRGPNIMQGYLNNPEATKETLDQDGWLRTGDLVYIDDDGYVYVSDRLKELIKYKGLQVAPAELEALLVTHPEIEDAAVVPLPDMDAGEVPMAYVVRRRGSSLKEADVIQFVASQVSPYKKVRKVHFIDAIPKSASGKILRRELPRPNVSSRL